jgi:signal transduction histidine kinase
VSALRPSQLALDVALAAGLCALGLLELWVPFESVQGDGSRAWTSASVVLLAGALAVRRLAPLPVALVVLLGFPVLYEFTPVLVVFWGGFLPMCVALFSVARYSAGRQPFIGAAAAASCLLYVDLRVDELRSPSEFVFHWTVFTLVWASGWALARLERRARVSTQRAIDAEVTAAAQVMAAVIDERTRIARELHDIVAHSVSMMVVQAGAAGRVVEDDPTLVRESLESIRATGSQALVEMRRLVAVMREGGEAGETGGLSPQPGVAAIPALVDEACGAGLDVTLRTSGRALALPPGLDLTVYRVVQEALTNVRRHAAARSAQVRMDYAPDALTVEVCDDGRGSQRPGAVAGHGLLGMRERVALYGGTLHVGRSPGQGFLVRAELPVTT